MTLRNHHRTLAVLSRLRAARPGRRGGAGGTAPWEIDYGRVRLVPAAWRRPSRWPVARLWWRSAFPHRTALW